MNGEVILPNGITDILWGTFARCRGLTSITIPEHIYSIKDGAFEGCTGLADFTVLGSNTSIDTWAFYECSPNLRFHVPANSAAEKFESKYFDRRLWSDDGYNPH